MGRAADRPIPDALARTFVADARPDDRVLRYDHP